MRSLLLVSLLIAASNCLAQSVPPSETSIRELLEVTQARNLMDNDEQLESLFDQTMKRALAGTPINAEQQKIMADMRRDMIQAVNEGMGWDVLEPAVIKLYRESLSQSEVDALLAFYKTDAGKSVINKMPQLMQGIMQIGMERAQMLAPRMRKLQDDYIIRLRAAGK